MISGMSRQTASGGEILAQVAQELLDNGQVVELAAQALAEVQHPHHGRKLFLLLAQPALFHDRSHPQQQMLDVEGLGDVVRRAVLHEIHGGLGGAVTGDDQEISVDVALADLAEQILTVHGRHAQVADDEIEAPLGQAPQGFLTVGRLGHGITGPPKGFLADFPQGGFIVHHQHVKSRCHGPTSPAQGAAMPTQPKLLVLEYPVFVVENQ